ncbi:MAG TPA: hypothetical protein DCY13_21520, partial [Verrucomicrobiales bacterium]|nr:hypothetical protein [Verrucomicrobiales bacterium]
MKHRIKRRKATTVTLAIACSSAGSMPGTAQAQNLDQPAAPLFELREGKLLPKQPPRMRHHVRVSYQPTFNISAEFTNLGFPSSTVPGPGAGLVDRDYDDGFVRLETTGPATGSPDGYTAYWSYENSNQVVGSDLLMRKATSSGTISSSGDIGDDPQHGVELGYAFEVGPVGRLYWGFEAAVSFIPVDIHDARPLTTDLTLITDTFDISNLDPGGGPPPPPGTPSTGRSGTSALILVEPVSRTLTPLTGSTVSGRRTVDANVFDIRIGP